MTTTTNGTRLTPHVDDLLRLADARAEAYAAADPFPHAVIDGLFDPNLLRRVTAELPSRDATGWTTWDTVNEWKYVFDNPERFGPHARGLANELNGSEFVRFLERISGIGGLVPDPHLTAAGYFDVRTGGFLDVHIDFARNPKLSLVRRINVLVYLNEDWQDDWGGELQLCRTVDGPPVQSVVPLFNRMVIFSTPDAAHGHPTPIRAPERRSRLCFSAYYFTSPDQPDSPTSLNGVLFAERHGGRRYADARRFVPPVVFDGIKAAKRRYKGGTG
ncbi:MAG: 2OG-Fe(II) oxygenase [Actinomycetota bacterium]|nr:2OG-Fe(II) oxygenase [Actinomycetota bacterium]